MQKFKRYVKCALPYIFCAFFPLLFAAGIRTYYSFSIQENLMDTVRRESAFATEKVESQLKLIQNYSFDLCQLTERSTMKGRQLLSKSIPCNEGRGVSE